MSRRTPRLSSGHSNDKASFVIYTECPKCGADLRTPENLFNGIAGRCRACHLKTTAVVNHHRSGALHPSAKLTPDQVREIRMAAGKKKQADMAEEFGVGIGTISRVVNRHSY